VGNCPPERAHTRLWVIAEYDQGRPNNRHRYAGALLDSEAVETQLADGDLMFRIDLAGPASYAAGAGLGDHHDVPMVRTLRSVPLVLLAEMLALQSIGEADEIYLRIALNGSLSPLDTAPSIETSTCQKP
jgi:hypothetical protein